MNAEARSAGSSRVTGSFWSALAWIVGLLMFFPVLWMVVTAFKQERDAFTMPPKFVFEPTFE
jgi:sorbitol/mannitol transport system permease protein